MLTFIKSVLSLMRETGFERERPKQHMEKEDHQTVLKRKEGRCFDCALGCLSAKSVLCS